MQKIVQRDKKIEFFGKKLKLFGVELSDLSKIAWSQDYLLKKVSLVRGFRER